jgi:hypothetical protein
MAPDTVLETQALSATYLERREGVIGLPRSHVETQTSTMRCPILDSQWSYRGKPGKQLIPK